MFPLALKARRTWIHLTVGLKLVLAAAVRVNQTARKRFLLPVQLAERELLTVQLEQRSWDLEQK